MRKHLILLIVVLLSCGTASAQFAVKTNFLYDATTTPNLGAELGVGKKHTIQLFYGLNPWSYTSTSHPARLADGSKTHIRQAKHWLLMPEFRWWPCSKFNGHFFGVHAMGGEFNAQNVDLPLPGGFFSGEDIAANAHDKRYEGKYLGAGFTYGYQWILGKHWNLEAEVGVGYDHVWYKKFNCGQCGSFEDKAETNYVGLTKLGLSLLYIF